MTVDTRSSSTPATWVMTRLWITYLVRNAMQYSQSKTDTFVRKICYSLSENFLLKISVLSCLKIAGLLLSESTPIKNQ
jgi:hypothetical protein